MDYEKKYKEAMEVMRQWIAPCHTSEQLEAMKKSVFPELATSEDERISDTIFNCLYQCCDTGFISGKQRDDALAYLEKQKEQKPKEWNEKPCLTCDEYDKGYKQGYTEGCTAGYNKAMLEQKPAEWSEEDTEMYINVASSLRGYACGLTNEEHIKHIKKGLDWLENRLKSLRPKWKPSEEQMDALNEAVISFEGYSDYDDIKSLYEQLKKLKEE